MAGGVNLNLLAEETVRAARFGGLSPDGYCYTFDERANGYVRGEGGAVVVLKPLDAAIADGDRVYCVLRGSAVNNDGATGGLTVPGAGAPWPTARCVGTTNARGPERPETRRRRKTPREWRIRLLA